MLDSGSDVLKGGIEVVEVMVLVEGVFGRVLEIVMEVVDWSFLVEDHPRRIVLIIVGGGIVRARVVSRVVFLGMFWIGEDSFYERSMKSFFGTFLGGFWVKELALDAMEMMIKKREWGQACSCLRDHFLLLDENKKMVTRMIQRE
ncbi:hypothetical protein Tco_1432728 [Tanacetum coccineum]